MSEEVQRFRPTNGRLMGVIGLVLCAFVAGLFVVWGSPRTAVLGVIACAVAAVLVWAAMLRPSVSAAAGRLLMKNLFHSVSIPLAAVDTVVVRRYLLVRAGGTKYISPAISRPLRKTVRKEMKWSGGGAQLLAPGLRVGDDAAALQTQDPAGVQNLDYADFVEQQIVALADDDRARRGIAPRSEEEYELGAETERHTAWLEIGALVVLGVAFVVVLFV